MIINDVQLEVVEDQRRGEWTVYEISPIPGQPKRAIITRPTRGRALVDVRVYLDERGSVFKDERSVVGV